MAQEPIRPVDHGMFSATAETAVHTVGGGVKGTVKGGLEGALTGALILGGIAAAIAFFASGIGAALVAGSILGVAGGALGLATGAPMGGLFGTIGGFRSGREKVANERAAAEVAQTQARIAEAQIHTADALRANVMAASPPVMVGGPGSSISSAAYFDKGVGTGAPAVEAAIAGPTGHAQRYLDQQAASPDMQAGR